MPRFQLLVKEPGKEPHVVQLGEPLVIGRGKAADVTVADEEVGRKQFEILVTAGFVVLKGLGKTNPTRVGDSLIQAGEQTTMASGTIIRVGKSEFVVEDAEKTEQGVAPRAPHPDQTIVSANPSSAAPPAAIPATSAQEPGPDQQETAEGDFGMTMAKGFRPGAAPPQHRRRGRRWCSTSSRHKAADQVAHSRASPRMCGVHPQRLCSPPGQAR